MKCAVVLSGEGARGSFQAGLLAAASQGNDIQNIMGVSSGSINAACYSLLGPTGPLDLWRGVTSINSIFTPQWLTFAFRNGFYSPQPAKDIIDKLYRENKAKCEAWVFSASLKDEVVSVRTASPESVLDSLRMAGIVDSDGVSVDAGIATMCPLNFAVNTGAEKIIVILGRRLAAKPWNTGGLFSFGGVQVGGIVRVAMRSVEIMLHRLLIHDLAKLVINNRKAKENRDKREIEVELWEATVDLYDTFDFKQSRLGLTLANSGNYQIHKGENILTAMGEMAASW